MKVVAFNGSARKDGNTAILINYALMELGREGIETELVQLAGKKIHGCIACYKCMQNKDRECAVKEDIANECIQKMAEADGIILGSPTYFADLTTEMKALIDRAGLVSRANDFMLKHKAGAAIVAARRAGGTNTFDSINHFFLMAQMIVPGSSYWNIGIGREKGDVEKDEEGIQTMKVLGQNMAWLLKNISR
ncbi:MAG: flavodoxin family protein [Syntrophobacteraceae bacterium]|nr:flavodoxin family protein [Syntrophobacteraceae bacterium]